MGIRLFCCVYEERCRELYAKITICFRQGYCLMYGCYLIFSYVSECFLWCLFCAAWDKDILLSLIL